jgi:hypothetical protein
MTPNPKRLCDDRLATDAIRSNGRQQPVQHSHIDGSLGLLAGMALQTSWDPPPSRPVKARNQLAAYGTLCRAVDPAIRPRYPRDPRNAH